HTPSGMTLLTNKGSSGTIRLGAVFGAVVDNPASFASGVSLRAGGSSTRVPAVALAFQPEANGSFSIGDIDSAGPEWDGSTMSSDSFPSGVSGDLLLGISMTNKSASTTLTTHATTGGGAMLV